MLISVSVQLRCEYCKTTKSREDSQSPLDTFHEDYDLGRRQMPCVRLVCKGFNLDLYNALLDALPKSLKRKASERMDEAATSTTKVSRTA